MELGNYRRSVDVSVTLSTVAAAEKRKCAMTVRCVCCRHPQSHHATATELIPPWTRPFPPFKSRLVRPLAARPSCIMQRHIARRGTIVDVRYSYVYATLIDRRPLIITRHVSTRPQPPAVSVYSRSVLINPARCPFHRSAPAACILT